MRSPSAGAIVRSWKSRFRHTRAPPCPRFSLDRILPRQVQGELSDADSSQKNDIAPKAHSSAHTQLTQALQSHMKAAGSAQMLRSLLRQTPVTPPALRCVEECLRILSSEEVTRFQVRQINLTTDRVSKGRWDIHLHFTSSIGSVMLPWIERTRYLQTSCPPGQRTYWALQCLRSVEFRVTLHTA